jgi:predicted DNA-binding protein YlxM (UPF0122 family)
MIRKCYVHDRDVHDQNQSQCDIGVLQQTVNEVINTLNTFDTEYRMKLQMLEERSRRLDAFEKSLFDLTDGATRK